MQKVEPSHDSVASREAADAQEESRIAAGLADLAAAALLLHDLVADGEEPGTFFDAAWSDEGRS